MPLSRRKSRLSIACIIASVLTIEGFVPTSIRDTLKLKRKQQQIIEKCRYSNDNLSQLRISLNEQVLETKSKSTKSFEDIDKVLKSFGLPWSRSISDADSVDDSSSSFLYYMPFWDWQISFMKENLTDLRIIDCTCDNVSLFPNSSGKSFQYKESIDNVNGDNDIKTDQKTNNKRPKSRIISLCFQSKEYRKIRMTFYENGYRGQSFNTVWYPHFSYNMPILGVNLLSKSKENKHLAMIDFQPLYEDESRHDVEFLHHLETINSKYYDKFPQLNGTDRVWKLKVFSPQMFCGRYENEDYVLEHVYPAYCDYVRTNVKLMKSVKPDTSVINTVRARHKAYDTYSAIRDPCTALLGSLFGKDWADEFVFGVLYSLSDRTEDKDYWE